ncbi:MAG: LTA synthase family protein, partial [Bacillota bacterium]
MKYLNEQNNKAKLFFLFILIGFLIKYNYLYYYIFQAPLISSIIIKNIINITLILLAAKSLIKNKKRIYFTLFLYILFAIFFFANLWYNRYFGNYLSLTDMTMGQGIRPIKVLLFQLFNYFDLIFFLEFPILIYLLFSISKAEKASDEFIKTESNHLKFNKNKIIIFLIIVILLGGQILYSSSLFDTDGFLDTFNYSTPAFVGVYGITPLYLAEYRILKSRGENTDDVEKDVEKDNIETDKKLSGEYEADDIENIIVIQLESLDEKIIDYEYNDKEVTPFLNSLREKSLYFDDIYAQHVNGSFDAEFSFLTSLYPINRNYAFKTNDMAEFNSIVKILNENNYQTMAFHGNEEKFFYRDKGYLEMEFDKFYSRSDFSAEKGEIGEETYLGINDYDFFQQSLEYLENAEKPFFAFYITVSSHTPFDFYPEEYEVEEYEDADSPL